MSGKPRPQGLLKSYHDGENELAQATRENLLVKTGIFCAETQEEGGHREVLEVGAQKVGREAAPGALVRDLGWISRRTADTSDKGTCEITKVR